MPLEAVGPRPPSRWRWREAMTVASPTQTLPFALGERHRATFLKGTDMIGASLEHRDAIEAFARRHWDAQPWAKDVAARTRARPDGVDEAAAPQAASASPR